MGFTLERVRKDFDSLRLSRIEELASIEGEDDLFRDERLFLEKLTFEDYMEAFGQVIQKGFRAAPFEDRKTQGLSRHVKYILDDNEDYVFGFFASDARALVRVACEVVSPESEVIQDITEVVAAGYYQEDEPVCANAIKILISAYPENSSRIVLAEGSTDTSIIRESLALLYPHLADYYSFFDFDASRSQGGAGHLVSIVKAFAAAGVANRVIALFDNDTGAREARRILDSVSLPTNIAVLGYPNLDKLRHYPTIGPTGMTLSDINGLAGSIELYLGEDILTIDGALSPVQWKGYSEALRAYHGEIMHKSQLQDAFLRKVQQAKADPRTMGSTDWSGMDAILRAIFTAFD
jgi:hypothetical protein